MIKPERVGLLSHEYQIHATKDRQTALILQYLPTPYVFRAHPMQHILIAQPRSGFRWTFEL
jgi:hypothetical protein